MVWQDQLLALFRGQSVFHQSQVKVFVGSVDFVADDRVSKMGEMDADLVFASGAGRQAQEGEGSGGNRGGWPDKVLYKVPWAPRRGGPYLHLRNASCEWPGNLRRGVDGAGALRARDGSRSGGWELGEAAGAAACASVRSCGLPRPNRNGRPSHYGKKHPLTAISASG